MRAIVTGGAGFIGSHLIEDLLARGASVTCVEAPNRSRGWIEGLPIRYLDHGIHDVDALTETVSGADVVFHLAGLTEARKPEAFYRVNTEGTECVLKAAARCNGRAPHVMLLSSLAATGPCRNGDLLSPDTVPFPLSHYGHSKLLAELVMHAYADRVPGTIVRFPSVYGPRERGVLRMFRLVRLGIALTVGSWDREISLIYVKDAVQALIAAADHVPTTVRTVCVAHPDPITWRAFAAAAAETLGRSPMLVSIPAVVGKVVAIVAELAARARRRAAILNRERLREIAQERWVCDTNRARTEIGFQPMYPITRGIGETVAWYREAQWL
jgi:nucleoside-diphosphate-sugar epimerase